jgi:hypothetical protein
MEIDGREWTILPPRCYSRPTRHWFKPSTWLNSIPFVEHGRNCGRRGQGATVTDINNDDWPSGDRVAFSAASWGFLFFLPLPRSTSCGGPPKDKRPTTTTKSSPSFDGNGQQRLEPLLESILFSIVVDTCRLCHRGEGGGTTTEETEQRRLTGRRHSKGLQRWVKGLWN